MGQTPARPVINLQHGAFDYCQQMKCPTLLKSPDCNPDTCERLDEERKRRGAIYMVRPDGENADFVGLLPSVR